MNKMQLDSQQPTVHGLAPSEIKHGGEGGIRTRG